MNTEDQKDLQKAHTLLHSPSIAMKAANMIGKPLEFGLEMLPDGGREMIMKATKLSLEKAMDAAVYTITDPNQQEASPWWHKIAVAASGAAGGAFGMGALAVELPISTVIMLRSIVDIARSEGEDITELEAKLECLTVFALGGESDSEDGAEVGYFATRMALARAMTEAVEYMAERAIVEGSAPVLVKLIATIAERFSIQVTEKVVAQAVPVLGAIGGATINTMFIDHFQTMARGHFIVKRLERKYGKEIILSEFNRLSGFLPDHQSSDSIQSNS